MVETPPSEQIINLSGLHNPFKGMKSSSSEHVPLPENQTGLARIAMDEEHDIGMLDSNTAWQGFKYRSYTDQDHSELLRGFAWTESELVVSLCSFVCFNRAQYALGICLWERGLQKSLRLSNHRHFERGMAR